MTHTHISQRTLCRSVSALLPFHIQKGFTIHRRYLSGRFSRTCTSHLKNYCISNKEKHKSMSWRHSSSPVSAVAVALHRCSVSSSHRSLPRFRAVPASKEQMAGFQFFVGIQNIFQRCSRVHLVQATPSQTHETAFQLC